MKASIVVLNHNTGPVLDRCLGSLLALDADDYEVLLIDNASTDGSSERAQDRFGGDERFRLLRAGRNLGCAGGRNRGIAESRGEIVCFVDGDAFADPGWLTAVRRGFEDPEVGVIASRLVSAENPLVLNGLGGMLNWQGYGFDIGYGDPAEFAEPRVAPLFACGNGLATRQSVVARIGGFDAAYFNYYEDVDFSIRARRAGYRVALADDAVLFHVLRTTDLTSNQGKALLCERNRIRTVLKHFPLGFVARWLPRELAHERESRADGYAPGIFRAAWRWNLLRVPALAWWRITHPGRRRGLDPTSLVPSWGHAPGKSYAIPIQPDARRSLREVALGRNDDGSLLYGWYPPETGPEGRLFRWTDDLAGLRLHATAAQGTVRLTYFVSPDHPATNVYLRHEGADAAVAGRLPDAPAYAWTTAEVPTPFPAGTIDVILQTPDPHREPAPGKRRLGVAIGECAVV